MSLYKHAKSKHWWCRFRVQGKEVRRSTGTSDRRRAAVEERRLRAYYEAKAPHRGARGSVGLADLGGLDCEEIKARGKSQSHIRDTAHFWRRLVEHYGPNTDPRKIDYDAVVNYIASRRDGGVRGQTIIREVRALKRGLKIAHRKGWLPVLPNEWPIVGTDDLHEGQAGKLHPLPTVAAWLDNLPQEARDQAELVLLTGLRRTESERLCRK